MDHLFVYSSQRILSSPTFWVLSRSLCSPLVNVLLHTIAGDSLIYMIYNSKSYLIRTYNFNRQSLFKKHFCFFVSGVRCVKYQKFQKYKTKPVLRPGWHKVLVVQWITISQKCVHIVHSVTHLGPSRFCQSQSKIIR